MLGARDVVRRYGMACAAIFPLASAPQNMTMSFPVHSAGIQVSKIYKSSAHPVTVERRQREMYRRFQRATEYVRKRWVLDALGGR